MISQAGECLKFEKCENFRELGGYMAADGRTVKGGMFYRAPALNTIKSSDDIALFASLHVKHIFDFRSSEERDAAPDPEFDGVTNHKIPARLTEDGIEQSFDLPSIVKMDDDAIAQLLRVVVHGYTLLPFQNSAYVAMFDTIKNGETPIIFHCTAGKDRTGVAAALILILLGVSEEIAIQDFLITNTCRSSTIDVILQKFAPLMHCKDADKFVRLLTGVASENLVLSFDKIKEQYGDYDSYFEKEYGIDKAMRENIKNMYLE